MFLDMLESYKRLFPVEDGYKLVLGCRNEIKTLLNTLGLDDGLVICEVTREKLMSNARYFWRCIHEIACLKPDLILHVRMHSHAEDVYIHGIPAAKKISVKGYNYITSSKIRTFFSENTYDEVLVPSEDKDQLACYAEMLR